MTQRYDDLLVKYKTKYQSVPANILVELAEIAEQATDRLQTDLATCIITSASAAEVVDLLAVLLRQQMPSINNIAIQVMRDETRPQVSRQNLLLLQTSIVGEAVTVERCVTLRLEIWYSSNTVTVYYTTDTLRS